jgi:broad specificity phosphatase PhoE
MPSLAEGPPSLGFALTSGRASLIFRALSMTLRRISLIRHGETDGNSRLRFHGAGDVALSAEGRAQMRAAARSLAGDRWDLVVASPLRRAWVSAAVVAPGRQILLEPDFREIDFGRWEGLTAEEIADQDPALYRDWQAKVEDFEFPDGERRADFRARVSSGLRRLLESGAGSTLVVTHKGVIRAIAEELCGEPPEQPHPELGELVQLSRGADGRWRPGPRSSNPPALG